MKKVIAIILAMFLLVGCGGAPKATPSSTPEPTPEPVETVAPTPEPTIEFTPEPTPEPEPDMLHVPLKDISIKLPSGAKGKVEDGVVTASIAVEDGINLAVVLNASGEVSDTNDSLLSSPDAVFLVATASYGATEYEKSETIDLGGLEALKFTFMSTGDNPLRLVFVTFIHNDHLYQMIIGAVADYAELETFAESVIQSIELG